MRDILGGVPSISVIQDCSMLGEKSPQACRMVGVGVADLARKVSKRRTALDTCDSWQESVIILCACYIGVLVYCGNVAIRRERLTRPYP